MVGAAAIIAACLQFPAARADVLYAVTLRNHANISTGGLGGNLYTIDADTGAARIVAPITLNGQPIGLRGIAIHPKTRVFYGITAGLTPNVPRSLVTLDPNTGKATLVGSLGVAGSDINFDEKGTLYIWLPDRNELGTVDLGTGAAKTFAESGIAETIGGGFAIDEKTGHALLSATSAVGTLDAVDLRTGRVTTGPPLAGAPFVSAMSALDFSPSGKLYGVNTNLGAPASATLVTIDPKTGVVHAIGALPNDTTAITFGPESDLLSETVTVRKWILAVLALAAVLGLGLAAYLGFRARRP